MKKYPVTRQWLKGQSVTGLALDCMEVEIAEMLRRLDYLEERQKNLTFTVELDETIPHDRSEIKESCTEALKEAAGWFEAVAGITYQNV